MKTLFSVILLFSFIMTYSQVTDNSDVIIDPIEPMPNFPGGSDSMWCFLETYFNYEILNLAHDPSKYVIKLYIDTLGHAKGFDLVTTIPRNIQIDSLIKSEIFRVTWKSCPLTGTLQKLMPTTKGFDQIKSPLDTLDL